jgi:DNA polymerase III subunit delta
MAPTALSFDALLKALKRGGAPDPVYYLHGEEDELKDEAVRGLLDRAVEPALRDFNVDVRSAGDLSPEALHALVNTPPMLAERRAVVLRGVEQLRKKSKARDALLDYLANPSPSTMLVLIQAGDGEAESDLATRATTVMVDRLSPERVPGWIAHAAGRLQLTLAPEAVELLIAAVGNDLGALSQELAKLAALAGGRTATADDVTALVGVRHGETLDDLVDAALTRDGPRAGRLVEPVLEQAGMSGVRVVTALGTALIGTTLARAELDRGASPARAADAVFQHLLSARPFGLGSYRDVAARWARWAGRWREPELRRALRAALDADRALKTTTVTEERGTLMRLVLEFAAMRREAA